MRCEREGTIFRFHFFLVNDPKVATDQSASDPFVMSSHSFLSLAWIFRILQMLNVMIEKPKPIKCDDSKT